MRVKLKVAIIEAGLTQREVAKRIGMHDTKLSAIINEYRLPSEDEQRAIAKVLRKPVGDLFHAA